VRSVGRRVDQRENGQRITGQTTLWRNAGNGLVGTAARPYSSPVPTAAGNALIPTMPAMLATFDRQLLAIKAPLLLQGWRRGLLEFWVFGIKEARACLFAALFFSAVILVPRNGLFGLPRYDVLLLAALAIQGWMLWAKLETADEVKAICLFHAIGFLLELFKTSSGIRSWSYPDAAYTKVFGVRCSGFMYAAVGSYMIQAWRLFDLRIRHHPPHALATLVALGIYANFFTHHYIGDYRWHLAALAAGLFARTTVTFLRWIAIAPCRCCSPSC
jgi:uncharacterized membrane protein YoaT (DUF817 family)